MITFGPVPSRRLGRSLGINNIPPKFCSYSCVYCQVGRTLNMQIERKDFYEPDRILENVIDKVNKAAEKGEKIDYLAFVPDGEPTLDKNLGHTIELLKPLGIKTAVITNSSLIHRKDVREALMKADWVSLKVDSTIEKVWHKTDRPHKKLELNKILEGMIDFKKEYQGELVTETLLVKDINDTEENLEAIANFLSRLQPARAYLSIPTRPPAEDMVHSPDELVINRSYQILSKQIDHVEYLIGYEGNAFATTGNIEEDLLSITSVHPMREEAVKKLLLKTGDDWSAVQKLINNGSIIESKHDGMNFYVRRFPRRKEV